MRVAVLGSSGFIGSSIADAVEQTGATVLRRSAPRLTATAQTLDGLFRQAETSTTPFAAVLDACREADVVVNAAGVSWASANLDGMILGANALLPAMVQRACTALDVGRLVHISSSGVQGFAPVLDESPNLAPFSPYTMSKALGEQLLTPGDRTIIFRPTSVHGEERAVTEKLVRFAKSPLASVAGAGDRRTPQVLVQNVADAIAFVALHAGSVPDIVLQPSEGLTTSRLLTLLGDREPLHLPQSAAKLLVCALTGRRSTVALRTAGRRAEMLWFGQDQVAGWLPSVGWEPRTNAADWVDLAGKVSANGRP